MEQHKKGSLQILKERISNFCRYNDLFQQLVERDIKMKYRRSFLGYVWSILSPLLTMVVMAIVFSMMFRHDIQYYPAYLLAGNTIFGFLRESSSHSITSITSNAALLKKSYVPKYVFTLSKVTSDLVNMLFSLAALIVVMIFTGVPFSWYTLLFFIPVIEAYVFCVGLGLLLSALNVFFRDIQYIWGVILTAWTYLTPLFYPMELLPTKLQWIISHFNPMFYYITQFRDLMIYGQMPWPPLIWRGAIISVIFLFLGTWSFLKLKDKFILHI